MYGYVTVNEAELSEEETAGYKARYCGLCSALKKRYGKAGQMTLQNDMVFLIYLLEGLYEPEEKIFQGKCILHPVKSRDFSVSDATRYAAGMNVALAWFKLKDDWIDDKKTSARLMMHMLDKGYKSFAQEYPKKFEKIAIEFDNLMALEKSGSDLLDDVSGCFGRVMSEVCDEKEDEWSDLLRAVGFFLGKFIYIMDAFEDMSEDQKRGSYNCLNKIFKRFEDEEAFDDFIYNLLNMTMAQCVRAFEMLPIVKNARVLRNILYAGVWIRWDELHKEKYKAKNNKDNDV